MARKDPLEAFKAQGQPQNPIGTLDEVLERKLPARWFPSCAEPSADETIRGCDQWYECSMSYKGLPAAEGGGPRNHCWERIKDASNGGGIVRNVQPCFWGVAQQEVVAFNKEILQVIADEGETYEELTSVPDQTSPRDGVLGYTKYDTKLVKRTVPAFVRPGKEQKLARAELRASIIERDKKRVEDARRAKQLGIDGDETPLNQRGRAGSQGSKSKG